MGTYLSTPVTDKAQESDEALDCRPLPLCWATVEMQGWRKSMEDAHVARTNVPLRENNNEDSDDPAAETSSSEEETAKVFGVFDGHGGPEVARFCALYIVSVLTQQPGWKQAVQDNEGTCNAVVEARDTPETLTPKETPVGEALVNAFHALDRLIDDPSRRDELLRLRNAKPITGTQLDIPPNDESSEAEETDIPETADQAEEAFSTNGDIANASVIASTVSSSAETSSESTSDTSSDDDSNKPTGLEEAVKQDQDMMLDDDDPSDDDSDNLLNDIGEGQVVKGQVASETMSEMIHRLLNLGTGADAGQVAVQLDGSSQAEPLQVQSISANTPETAESTEFCASVVRNGRLICNLPDHPIHAGATAVVAVILGNKLTVANAGDSRAILCRNGMAYALSADHKPLQDREMRRIRNAGGFVNHFGRVNGNLNLSRSIGDLKYKQVPGLSPAEQMITAEPDILQTTLEAGDEFLVLGCDGIFDCLTNEKCVEYVRSRINEKSPTEIGIEMLDEIISDDPRASQGIGGDNMTIMIVDLQPLSRPYRKANMSAL